MNIVSALPGETYFGLSLARIARTSEHTLRVQRFPTKEDRLRELKAKRTRRKKAVASSEKPLRKPIVAPRRPGWHPGNAVLNPDSAREIYAQRGRVAASVMSHQYGIHVRSVRDIWTGRSWAHATGHARLEAGSGTQARAARLERHQLRLLDSSDAPVNNPASEATGDISWGREEIGASGEYFVPAIRRVSS